MRRSVRRIYLEIWRVNGKRTRVLGVRNNVVDIILVGETTKELEATLYESIFGDICHQFIIVNYVRKLKHNDSFTPLRAARSIFVHAPGILNFHGDTHKPDSSNYKALVLTHFLAHLRCAH